VADELPQAVQEQNKDQHKPEYSLFREKGFADSLYHKAVSNFPVVSFKANDLSVQDIPMASIQQT